MHAPDVRGLFAALASDRARARFASAKALRQLSETDPVRVYRQFDDVLRLLRQPNRILQWNGMRILANLAPVDDAGRIDAMLEEYLAPITGGVMITAAHAIAGGAVIAAAKPHLAAGIVRRILLVESAVYATPECRNIAIGHALRACEQIAPLLPDAGALRAFAARQLDNPRPATQRKAARLMTRLKSVAG